jgi:membrane protease YdiL (CAAX protease family)
VRDTIFTTELSQNIDMSNPDPTFRTPQLGRVWGFWATAFFSCIAYGVFGVAGWLAQAAAVAVGDAQTPLLFGRLFGIGGLAGDLAAIAVLWGAIRETRREFSEYLALTWPSRDEFVIAFMITLVLFVISSSVAGADDAHSTGPIAYLSVGSTAGLLTLLISGCITGPIMEEFVCRGFMFRGWSESFLGPVWAIVLISALWAVTHFQYDWLTQFWIFLSGLALGYFRWRSNSTWLAVVIHSTMNIYAFFTMGRYI